MRRVLVVDDEPGFRKALDIDLTARHYTVSTAPDGVTALTLVSLNPPDVIVLDLGLPDMAGIDVILGVRAWTPLPIIVVSGRSDPADKVPALDAGADDYLTKPFSMDELAARLRAVFRRPAAVEEPQTVDVGGYRLDLAAFTVGTRRGRGKAPHLTPTEWRLLMPLLRNPGRLVTGRQLLREVWGPGNEMRTNYLRVYLATLRHKLEPDPAHPRHLITVPGLGYRFEP
ncbi:response regulator transcription factor [Streptomyces sp. MI02-7b]|uniref:response regulator transcription factor n=1 Tax=Streptomyces sp. MI02-7b TaxID=462941 RepID=UPI0029BE5BFD|nr:response regulator transcription factor [Streptomyces sp. MI02-7b]MDX3073761.1 response regulator transcription factor [Streptomyces sp. MI02-7b]